MNKVVCGLVGGVIGTVVGSIGSYIFFKKKYKNLYYESLRKAIDEECDSLRARHCESVVTKKESNKNDISSITDAGPSISSIIKQYQCPRAEEIVGENPPPEAVDGTEGPILIDEEEYRFLPPKYETHDFQYLLQDGTLLDENDELVLEPNIYITKDMEDYFKRMSPQSCFFVLIENMSIAVQIETFDESYESMFGEG